MTEFLYDTVRFYYLGKYNQAALMQRLDSKTIRLLRNKNTGEDLGFKGYIRNMCIEAYPDRLFCTGSLPKFVHGHNVVPISAQEIKEALTTLFDALGVDIRHVRITRIDLAYTFVMNNKVSKYLECLGSLSRHKRHDVVKGETLNYEQGKNTAKLSFYNKVLEMDDDNSIEIPQDYQDKNLLRYEYRFHNISRISSTFATPINGNMLQEESFHQFLVKKWLERYLAIEKMPNLCLSNVPEKIKRPNNVVKYLLSRLLQYKGCETYSRCLDFIEDTFKGNAQSCRRCKGMLKKIHDYASSSNESCDLMKELTEKIQAVARRYNVE